MKIRGYSQEQIADFLNKEQISTPAEYKKSIGLKYQCGFQSTSQAKWTAVAVSRILKNPIYIGTLIQGKRGTPNYKIKKMRVRDKSEWVVVEHNHPAIIDPLIFSVVQKLMERDTRRSPYRDTVLPLAGTLFCPDCKRAMHFEASKEVSGSIIIMFAPLTRMERGAAATVLSKASWRVLSFGRSSTRFK